MPTIAQIDCVFDRNKSSERRYWQEYCIRQKLWEVPTVEYVKGLSSYLLERVCDLSPNTNYPLTVLEVAAGNGNFSHHLRKALDQKAAGAIKLVATDNGYWYPDPYFPAEIIDQKLALQKNAPAIAICSWMPWEEDFTSDFRTQQSVKEYILIGEIDGDCCGDPWLTWGRDISLDKSKKGLQLPFEADGFERVDLEHLWHLQVSRTQYSATVSFRRKPRISPGL